MICSKSTVKATGLNIWYSGGQDHREPEVEYVRSFAKVIEARQVTALQASSRFKVLVLIHTTHGLGSKPLLPKRPDLVVGDQSTGCEAAGGMSRLTGSRTSLKRHLKSLKRCGFVISYRVSFHGLELRPIVTTRTGDEQT